MTSQVSCALCRCPDSTLVQVGVRQAPQLEVRRCAGCGLVFLWPQPTDAESARYYAGVYRQDYAEPPLQERYQNDLDEARTRVRRLLPYLRQDTRLLEVGSGSGAFLTAARPYVGEVAGVEPDIASRRWIEKEFGLRLLAQVDDALAAGKRFNLVALFHVLEHVLEPTQFLRNLSQLLQPDGTLIIEMPNVDDMLVTVYDIPAYPRFYYQKAHLYYFSKASLERVLEAAGLEADIRGIQRYDLSNHIRWMLTGKPGGQGYYDDILSPSVHAAYADALARAGHSDTLWAVARSKSTHS